MLCSNQPTFFHFPVFSAVSVTEALPYCDLMKELRKDEELDAGMQLEDVDTGTRIQITYFGYAPCINSLMVGTKESGALVFNLETKSVE